MFRLFPGRNETSVLVARMVGVKMGDRVAHVGCMDGSRLAATAAGVGLSGRAVAFVPDEPAATRVRKGAAQVGVLVEVETTPPTQMPSDADAFDVAVVDDTGGLFHAMRAEDRVMMVRELVRILRPGGRVVVVGRAARGGLRALLSRTQSGRPFNPVPPLLADGFVSARTLAERDGLVFVEALKPRGQTGV